MGMSGVSYTSLPGLAGYALNDLDESGPMYIGKATADGRWLVQRFTTSSLMEYANISNNPSVTTYASAWTARAALTYGAYQTLSGV